MWNWLLVCIHKQLYYFFYSSGMSHLFLFPIWLLLSIPDKILSLVRAALWGDGNVFMEGSAAG